MHIVKYVNTMRYWIWTNSINTNQNYVKKATIIWFLAIQTERSIHIYPTPPFGQDMTQGQFLSGV